jgi:hypothetical protein
MSWGPELKMNANTACASPEPASAAMRACRSAVA